MKRFYSFLALLMCMLSSLTASAQSEGSAVVNIDAVCYTFAIQDVNAEDPRQADLLSVIAGGAAHKATETIALDGEKTVRLFAQAPEDIEIVVMVDGANVEMVKNGTSFEGYATIKPGSVIDVLNEAPHKETTLMIGFMEGDYAAYANQIEVTIGETPVTTETVTVELGTKVSVKAAEGYEIEKVYYCNDELEAVDGVYSFVVIQENPLLIVDMKEPVANAVAQLYGSFFTFSAQDVNAEDPRKAEIFSITPSGEAVNKYIPLVLDGEKTVRLVGQAQDNAIYVTLNGVQVISTMDEMFQAEVTLNAGSVLKIYNAAPYTTKMDFGFMQKNVWAAPQVEIVMDKIVPVDLAYAPFFVPEGTEFQIKAKEGSAIANVYYCNEDVEAVEGVYTVAADREGDALTIIDLVDTRSEAVAYIGGNFYTVTLTPENSENSRDQVLDVEFSETSYSEYRSFRFEGENFKLQAYNQADEFYVYLNGEPVANTVEGGQGFVAMVTLKANDVLKIYDAEPANVKVDMGFQFGSADQVDVVMDKLVSVSAEGVYDVLQGTEFQIKAKPGKEIANVYYCNMPVYPNDGVYTVKATEAGDAVLIIDMLDTRKEAVAYVNGTYYTVTLTPALSMDSRDQILDVQYSEEAYDEYRSLKFDDDTFILKAYNPNNTFFVYLDGELLLNRVEEGSGFEAQVTLKEGSALKIYDAEPYVTNMSIGFMQEQGVGAARVNVVMDEVKSVDVYGTDPIQVLQGTKFQIAPVEGYTLGHVYYCNDEIYPVGGVYTVTADRPGDAMVVIDLYANDTRAIAYLSGEFYTFTATPAASVDNRDQALVVEQGTYAGYRDFRFDINKATVNLKGMNPTGEFYVYLDDQQVESYGNAGEMYEAQVTLQQNSVLKVYDHEPFTSFVSVNVEGNDLAGVENKISITKDQVVPVTDYMNPDALYTVLEGTEFKIEGIAYGMIQNVYINGEEVVCIDNAYTVAAKEAGNMVVTIYLNDTADGINAVNAAAQNKIYNLQGVAVKSANKPGLYIINGKKVAVK